MKSSGAALALLLCLGVDVHSIAAEPGFYAGADIGVVAPTIDKSDGVTFISPPEIRHFSPEAIRFDESELGWSALVGYRVKSHSLPPSLLTWTSVRSTWRKSYDLSDDPSDSQLTFFDFNSQVSGPMVSVMGFVPLAGKFEAFGRAGVLWATRGSPAGSPLQLQGRRGTVGIGTRTSSRTRVAGGRRGSNTSDSKISTTPSFRANCDSNGFNWAQPTASARVQLQPAAPGRLRTRLTRASMQSRISASPNLQSERAMDFSFLSRIYRAPYSKCVRPHRVQKDRKWAAAWRWGTASIVILRRNLPIPISERWTSGSITLAVRLGSRSSYLSSISTLTPPRVWPVRRLTYSESCQ